MMQITSCSVSNLLPYVEAHCYHCYHFVVAAANATVATFIINIQILYKFTVS